MNKRQRISALQKEKLQSAIQQVHEQDVLGRITAYLHDKPHMIPDLLARIKPRPQPLYTGCHFVTLYICQL